MKKKNHSIFQRYLDIYPLTFFFVS